MVKTHAHINKVSDLKRIAKLAKHGGRLVKAVSWGSAAYEFHTATRREDKIGIVADTVGGVVAGAAAGVALVAMATPVGWITAVVVVAGAGIAGGAAAETLAEGWLANNWKYPWEQFLD
ncbi:MAG: hypothetical protein AAF667_09195 [Pseudomonadota bacterium]